MLEKAENKEIRNRGYGLEGRGTRQCEWKEIGNLSSRK